MTPLQPRNSNSGRVRHLLRRVVLEPLFVLAIMAVGYVICYLAVVGVEAITR